MKNTFVCLSSYYKGYEFLEESKKLGNKVILITSESLKDKNWPWHAIDEVYYMPETTPFFWNMEHLIAGCAYLMKNNRIETVVALDDFDVEKAALIRETFRIPGMGQTTHRYFRDKLAMRQQAKDSNIDIPPFTAIFNDEKLNQFVDENPAPWVLKPRSEASASGIIKIHSKEQLWEIVNNLGDERPKFLLEVFKPGDVFHVDSLVFNKKVVFTSCSQYLSTPMEVSHDGGVFRTKTLDPKSTEFKALKKINNQVLTEFGLVNGATHSEFIRGKENGKWYFLETSSRVGGAHIPDLIEAATGVNIWREWAKIETALLNNEAYKAPKSESFYAGLIIALAKEQHPNLDEFRNEELAKTIDMEYHIALVYSSIDKNKIQTVLDDDATKIIQNHLSILPATEKPCH